MNEGTSFSDLKGYVQTITEQNKAHLRLVDDWEDQLVKYTKPKYGIKRSPSDIIERIKKASEYARLGRQYESWMPCLWELHRYD